MESLREIIGENVSVTDQGMISSPDGTRIFYEVFGEGKPLVFCYGLVCRREHWRHQLSRFYPGYQLITFDYRGHHRSEVPKNTQHLTIDWCAQDVISLLDHLKVKEAVVFGHSLGVAIAARAATLDPERVKALILVCGSATNPFEGMFFTDKMDKFFKYYTFAYEHLPGVTSLVWGKMTELNRLSIFLTAKLGFNPYLAEEKDVLSYMEGVKNIPLPVFYHLIKNYTEFDGRKCLGEVTCPTLIIAGTEDCITPMVLQEEMAQLIANSILEKIPMGSHNAHSDLPEMVNHKIESFLDRLDY